MTTQDGRAWYIKGYPVRDDHGNVLSAVEVAREITAQKQTEREQEAIIQLSTALRRAQTRAEMLPIIVDQIHDLAEAHGTALGLCDPSSGDIVVEVGIGGATPHIGAHFPQHKGITGHVMSSGESYVHNDLKNDELLYLTSSPTNPNYFPKGII